MPNDRPWSDADRELVADALGNVRLFRLTNATWSTPDVAADAVLDALTAAGWRREADVRAEMGQEIAQVVRHGLQITHGEEPTGA